MREVKQVFCVSVGFPTKSGREVHCQAPYPVPVCLQKHNLGACSMLLAVATPASLQLPDLCRARTAPDWWHCD